jgi:hypothetical protein
MSKYFLALSLVALLAFSSACGSGGPGGSKPADTGKVVKSAPVGSLTVEISSPSGQLKHGGDEFLVTFKDSSGKPVDVGAAALTFHMAAMGPMAAMNDQTAFTTTSTPGVYRGKANVEMAGEWQAQVSYEGPAGKGQTSFPVTVR